MSAQSSLPANLKYLRLVLCGAMRLLESEGEDIRDYLLDNGRETLAVSLDTARTGVFWVCAEIGRMPEESSLKKKG